MFADDNEPVIEIPQPNYPDETPAEAFEAIVRETIQMAKEMGHMEDEEINNVLEKILSERYDEFRNATFKIHTSDDE